jgi:hypothetical protein
VHASPNACLAARSIYAVVGNSRYRSLHFRLVLFLSHSGIVSAVGGTVGTLASKAGGLASGLSSWTGGYLSKTVGFAKQQMGCASLCTGSQRIPRHGILRHGIPAT